MGGYLGYRGMFSTSGDIIINVGGYSGESYQPKTEPARMIRLSSLRPKVMEKEFEYSSLRTASYSKIKEFLLQNLLSIGSETKTKTSESS